MIVCLPTEFGNHWMMSRFDTNLSCGLFCWSSGPPRFFFEDEGGDAEFGHIERWGPL